MGYVIFWLALAILTGVYASKKGFSGIGYFFLAIILSPLVGFLIALLSKEKKSTEVLKKEAHQKRIEEFKESKMLFDEGIITEEEFNEKKEILKSKMKPKITNIITPENKAKLIASLDDDDMVTFRNKKMGYEEIAKASFYQKMVKEYGEEKFVLLKVN